MKKKTKIEPEFYINKGPNMNWGKCSGCPFMDLLVAPKNLKGFTDPSVHIHCQIYNETVRITECIRKSESEYRDSDSGIPPEVTGFGRNLGVTKVPKTNKNEE